MLKSIVMAIFSLFVVTNLFAEVAIPDADIKGARDSDLVGRFSGSWIISYTHRDFDELTLPLSQLEAVKGKREQHNNTVYEPQQKKSLEGKRTRLVYLTPEGTSPLEVVRNYQQELDTKEGKVLFECQEEECGGSPTRSSSGGGGKMSLAMYLWPEEKIEEAIMTVGYCAQTETMKDQRYSVIELADKRAYVSILTYLLTARSNSCKILKDRTIVVVDIIEVSKMETKMERVQAEEMAQDISEKGSVALYGIYFDSGKADIKAESKETTEQIAQLLRINPEMELLVVGHTDNIGSFTSNLELSERRAAAVVDLLITTYNIDKNRLRAFGASFASPVTSNATEDGRAKNRRVELVESPRVQP